MTGIVVAPDLERVLVSKRGIFTIPAEDAMVACLCTQGKPCPGIEIGKIPLSARAFELLAVDMGKRFIERQKPRGLEWVQGDLRLHGPWPSYDLNRNLLDINSSLLAAAGQRSKEDGLEHPEQALDAVFEREACDPYVDYLLVGRFLMRDAMTDLEVPA